MSTTPFGSPVLPDVYWTSTVSSAFAAQARPSRPPCGARVATSSTVTTARNDGTRGESILATMRASGKDTSTTACAFVRIRAWRGTCSPTSAALAGG